MHQALNSVSRFGARAALTHEGPQAAGRPRDRKLGNEDDDRYDVALDDGHATVGMAPAPGGSTAVGLKRTVQVLGHAT